MKRKYGAEFIRFLERNNKIGSYCATDDKYIEYLEKELTKAKSKIARIIKPEPSRLCYYPKPCGTRLNHRCDLFNPKKDCPNYTATEGKKHDG